MPKFNHRFRAFFAAALCVAATTLPCIAAGDPIKQGDDYINEDRVKEAIAAYRRAVDSNPSSSAAHQRLGRAYALASDLSDAAKQLQQAIKIDPKNAAAHLDLGWVYGMQDQYQSAIAEERIAASYEPKNASAFLNLGVALVHVGDYKAAAAALKTALSLEPDNFDAYLNMASLLARQEQYRQAAEFYRRAIVLDNNSAAAHLGLGGTLGHLGDKEGQVRELKLAAELAPNNASAHGRLGFALYQVGNVRDAMAEGFAANRLRLLHSSTSFFGTFITAWAALFLIFGAVFATMFTGSRFTPKSDETLQRSFFLVFYKDKPGRLVITSRRLVYVPEAFSQWFGATRLSFDNVDIETFRGFTALQGGHLALLCTNGTVYHFAMPQLVLEPLLIELKKLKLIPLNQELIGNEMDVRASQTSMKVIVRGDMRLTPEPAKEEEEPQGEVVTVVPLPDEYKELGLDEL